MASSSISSSLAGAGRRSRRPTPHAGGTCVEREDAGGEVHILILQQIGREILRRQIDSLPDRGRPSPQRSRSMRCTNVSSAFSSPIRQALHTRSPAWRAGIVAVPKTLVDGCMLAVRNLLGHGHDTRSLSVRG